MTLPDKLRTLAGTEVALSDYAGQTLRVARGRLVHPVGALVGQDDKGCTDGCCAP